MRRAALLYTDNRLPDEIWQACQSQLLRCLDEIDLQLLTVSLKPVDVDLNLVLDFTPSPESMFRQILAGLRALREYGTEVVYLIEHDVLYHPTHFDFEPIGNAFCYNLNQWHVWSETGQAFTFLHDDPSQLCARLEVLLDHYQRVVDAIDRQGYNRSWGFSPPRGLPSELRQGTTFRWSAQGPNIDIRHPGTLTRSQLRPEDFRSARSCQGWTERDDVPGWGRTRGCFPEFLAKVTT